MKISENKTDPIIDLSKSVNAAQVVMLKKNNFYSASRSEVK